MHTRLTALILALSGLAFAGGSTERRKVSAHSVLIEDGVRLCRICHIPFVIGFGYIYPSDEKVSPDDQRSIVAFIFAEEIPNPRPWFVQSVRGSSRDEAVDFEYCCSCEEKLSERLEAWIRSPPTKEEFERLLKSKTEKGPNQPAQHNAGSRPSSGDSPASEIPSAPAPRG